MRVLWLCNIMIPAIGEALGLPCSNREGWLTGLYERLRSRGEKEGQAGRKGEIELGICFPVPRLPREVIRRCSGRPGFSIEGAECYPFVENLAAPERYDPSLEGQLRRALEDFRPDLVHIFGTEFPHALAMARAYDRPERTLVGLQGICYACAESYMADLPERVIAGRTFRDWLKKDSILQQQEKFRRRGEREREVLGRVGHVTGRTDFDRREAAACNAKAVYHFMNETMRRPFYSGRWEPSACTPCRIFLSQGDYPLKGFHYVLRALPEILETYPRARVCVAGSSVINFASWKDRIKISSYGRYLLELIREHGLEGHVEMLGRLSAEEMKEQLLKSSLFLCPSSLENSPNSLAEAMLLGVPSAASRTGGIPSLLAEEKEGLLFRPGDVKGLAEAVMRIWREPEEAARRAEAGRMRAMELYDGEKNYRRLLEIYREICL